MGDLLGLRHLRDSLMTIWTHKYLVAVSMGFELLLKEIRKEGLLGSMVYGS